MQNTPQQTTYNNDEIDLFDLLETIWQSKWFIITVTVACIILAGAYAFTAKEQWTSSAQVRVPEPSQLENYLNLEEAYYRYGMLDLTLDPSKPSMSSPATLDVEASLANAFTIFSTSLFAIDERLQALNNSTYYQKLAQDLEDEVAQRRLLNDMASADFNVAEAIKNNRSIYNVQFSAESQSDAQNTLVEILEHINDNSLKLLYERLESRINNRILFLETRGAQLKSNSDQERENRLLELEQALQIARAAGVTDYTGNSPVMGNSIIDLKDSQMLFMLGENYLQAQLQTLSNTPTIYPPSYYEIEHNADNLKSLLGAETQGEMFVYTQTPQLPLSKDKPRKALILVLGAVLGGVIGTFIVLIRSALRNRRALQSQS